MDNHHSRFGAADIYIVLLLHKLLRMISSRKEWQIWWSIHYIAVAMDKGHVDKINQIKPIQFDL